MHAFSVKKVAVAHVHLLIGLIEELSNYNLQVDRLFTGSGQQCVFLSWPLRSLLVAIVSIQTEVKML